MFLSIGRKNGKLWEKKERKKEKNGSAVGLESARRDFPWLDLQKIQNSRVV